MTITNPDNIVNNPDKHSIIPDISRTYPGQIHLFLVQIWFLETVCKWDIRIKTCIRRGAGVNRRGGFVRLNLNLLILLVAQ